MKMNESYSVFSITTCKICGEAVLGTWNAQMEHELEHKDDK